MTDETAPAAAPRLGWRDIGAALRFPARRGPLRLLALAALGLTVKPLADRLLALWPPLQAGLATPAALAWGVLGLGALAVLPRYFGGIVRGQQDPPLRPGLAQPQTLVLPALKMAAVALWSFLPLVLYLATVGDRAPRPSVALALLAIASFYLPMALLRQVITARLWPALLPSNVIDPVAKTFRNYWPLWLLTLLVTLFLAGSVLLARVPVIGPTLAVFAGLYLLCFAMHVLARFYRLERGRLAFAQDDNAISPAPAP